MDGRLRIAKSIFPKLKEEYKKFILNPEAKLREINGLSVLPIFEDELPIDVFGKKIEVRFKLVFQGELEALGQITTFLLKMERDTFISETEIHSVWIDQLGNIRNESTSYSASNVSEPGALINFVNTSLSKLLQSCEFSITK